MKRESKALALQKLKYKKINAKPKMNNEKKDLLTLSSVFHHPIIPDLFSIYADAIFKND